MKSLSKNKTNKIESDNTDVNSSSSSQCKRDVDKPITEKSPSTEIPRYKYIGYFNYKLYLQDSDYQTNYNKQLSELQSWFHSTEVSTLGQIHSAVVETKVYGAFIDTRIERVIIRDVEERDGAKRFKCYLIDVFSVEYVEEKRLFLLPEHFEQRPPLVKPYRLHKVYLQTRHHRKIFSWFSKRLADKSLSITKMYSDVLHGQPIDHIKLFDGSTLINEEICEKGLGIPVIGKEKKPDKKRSTGSVPRSRERKSSAKNFSRLEHQKFDWHLNSQPMVFEPSWPSYYVQNSSIPSSPLPSFYEIPPPPSFCPLSSNVAERDRLIDNLKGEIRAYKDLLNSQKQSRFSTNLQSASDKLRYLANIRMRVNPAICDESALTRSVELLFEDTSFHCDFDSAIEEGTDLQKKIARSAKIPLEKISFFEAQVSSLKLSQRGISIQVLEEELQSLMRELSSYKIFKRFDQEKSSFVTYTRVGKELLEWKDQYLGIQSKTDEAVGNLSTFLEGCTNFFKGVLQGPDELEAPQFSFYESLEISGLLDEEHKCIKNIDLVLVACEAVLRELKLRMSKMKNVDVLLTAISNIDPQLISESSFIKDKLQPKEGIEEGYPTLLKFITNSKAMTPQTKYMIIKDIFNGLTELHEKGESYFYLTPSNIFISGGAILCPADKLSVQEPIPPFKFFAPECHLHAELGASKAPFSIVGPSADFYSLGQIILWLASVDTKINFLEFMIDLQEEFPFLKQLTSEIPSERPTKEEIQTAIEEQLPFVFGITKEDLTKAFIASEECSSSSSSSFSEEKFAKMLADEEKLISEEMQDSGEDTTDETN